jgi:hypothetical protein
MEISENIGEFVGFFIGDGFANKYGNQSIIEFVGHPNDDKEYFYYQLIPLIRTIFPDRPHITNRERGLRLRYNSKHMLEKISKEFKLPLGKKSSFVKIPNLFLKNNEIIKSVLRGIFDADGSVIWDKRKIYKKPYPRLSITTISKKLAYQLKNLLKYLGFNPFLIEDKWKNERTAYHIDLYGFKQLNKWIEDIGFSNPKHIKRLLPQ